MEGGDNLIFSYSRAQALQDGVLVDLTEDPFGPITKSHFKVHVACTSTLFGEIQESMLNDGSDWQEVLHDIYSMATFPGNGTRRAGILEEVVFQVVIGTKMVPMKMVAGPGDHGELVLTLMGPLED